jgi:hypothetical protein
MGMPLFAVLIAGSLSLGKLAVPHIAPVPFNAVFNMPRCACRPRRFSLMAIWCRSTSC